MIVRRCIETCTRRIGEVAPEGNTMDINTKAIGEVVLALLYPWNQNRACKRSGLVVKQNELRS